MTGPIIATTLVLMSVFVPVAFMPGITGQLYRQFALTIAFSVGISAINALTLSPALCAALLRPTPKRQAWFFRKFNQVFDWCRNQYLKGVRMVYQSLGTGTAGFRRAFICHLLYVSTGSHRVSCLQKTKVISW